MARFEPLKSATISTSSSGELTFAGAPAPGIGFKIRVHSYRLVGGASSTANVATWLDGTGGAAKGDTIPLLANTGVVAAVARPDFLFELSDNKALILSLSAAQLAQGGVTWSVVKNTGLTES